MLSKINTEMDSLIKYNNDFSTLVKEDLKLAYPVLKFRMAVFGYPNP